jgi:hypothetical protein
MTDNTEEIVTILPNNSNTKNVLLSKLKASALVDCVKSMDKELDRYKSKMIGEIFNEDEKIVYMTTSDFCGHGVDENGKYISCDFINHHYLSNKGIIYIPRHNYIKKGNNVFNVCSSCSKICDLLITTEQKEIETGIIPSDHQIFLLNSFSDDDVTTEIIESVLHNHK